MSALRGELLRYAFAGAVNTAATTAVFYGLSLLMSPALAFTITYLAAIVILTIVIPRYVFRARPRAAGSVALAVWYVVVYLVGLLVIGALRSFSDADRAVVTLVTVGVTAPLSFLGARVISRRSSA
jgi:putative flippase GtrA